MFYRFLLLSITYFYDFDRDSDWLLRHLRFDLSFSLFLFTLSHTQSHFTESLLILLFPRYYPSTLSPFLSFSLSSAVTSIPSCLARTALYRTYHQSVFHSSTSTTSFLPSSSLLPSPPPSPLTLTLPSPPPLPITLPPPSPPPLPLTLPPPLPQPCTLTPPLPQPSPLTQPYFLIHTGLLSSSGVFVLGTVVFVLACYPTDKVWITSLHNTHTTRTSHTQQITKHNVVTERQ